MSIQSRFENAAEQMRQLLADDVVSKVKSTNEATNRLLLINRVLRILGWSEEEYNPEQALPTRVYTDYQLKIDNRTRLIVEAKRYGPIQPLPQLLHHSQYSNATLYNNCGPEMKAVIDQCVRYCAVCGVNYAVATSGEVWIILLASQTGFDWDKLKAFVFHSVEDINQRFAEFYSLISREAVQEHKLEERFSSTLVIKPSATIRPADYIVQVPDTGEIPERTAIDAFFDWFMDDITGRAKAEMLKQCYVADRRRNDLVQEMQQLWEHDAVINDQAVRLFDEEENGEVGTGEEIEDRLEKELESQLTEAGFPKIILLVGNIGAGKSTLVQRFNRYIRLKARSELDKQDICVVVDLINEVTKNIKHDHDDEIYLAQLVLAELRQEFQSTIDPDSKEVLWKCFEPEMSAFRKLQDELFKHDHVMYAIEEAKLLGELSRDSYRHLVGYLLYARKHSYNRRKGHRVWITFDNVDRGSYSYQEFVYSFAHQLAEKAGCTVIITLREDTFREAQATFLDVRSSDRVFPVEPPDFRQVISRRRKYVEHLLQRNKLPKRFQAVSRLVELLNLHITELLLKEKKEPFQMVVSLSMKNVRAGLALLREYYTSYHSTFHELYQAHKNADTMPTSLSLDDSIEHARLIQALMLGANWSYQEGESKIFNIFAGDDSEQSSHFLMLKILAYLQLKHNPHSSRKFRGVKYEILRQAFLVAGYNVRHINEATYKLYRAELISSPNPPRRQDSVVDRTHALPDDMQLLLSLKGFYYLKFLASHFYYQTRVGEDMIWYNEERSQDYISNLQASVDAQVSYQPEDALIYTDAREVFLTYLREMLAEEIQLNSIRSLSGEWMDIQTLVEQSVFSKQISKGYYATTATNQEVDNMLRTTTKASTEHISGLKPHHRKIPQNQPSLFAVELEDEDTAIRQAVASLGFMPIGTVGNYQRYLVRILWALEVAYRAGLPAQRARRLALIISNYGGEQVEGTNVARFFRQQRIQGTHKNLWNEEPEGHYTINGAGQNLLAVLMSQHSLAETENDHTIEAQEAQYPMEL